MHHPSTCVARCVDTARAVMRVEETLGKLLKFMNDATLRAEYRLTNGVTMLDKLPFTCVASIICTFIARLYIWGFCTQYGLLERGSKSGRFISSVY